MQTIIEKAPASTPKTRQLDASERARRFIRQCQREMLAVLYELRRHRARKGQR